MTLQTTRLTLSTRVALAVLASVLALGATSWLADDAHAEFPAEVWNVDGNPFGGEASFSGASSQGDGFEIEIPDLNYDIVCSESVTGTIAANDEAEFTSILSNCSDVIWEEICTVSVTGSATFDGNVGGPITPSGQFVFNYKGDECPLTEYPVRVAGIAMDLDFGTEAVNMPVTISAEHWVEAGSWAPDATISSSTEWLLTGANEGHEWSFGPPGEPPAESWNVDGNPFGGEAWFIGHSAEGGGFEIEIPENGSDIVCSQTVSGKIVAYDEAWFTNTFKNCADVGPMGEVCTVSVAPSSSITFRGIVSGPLTPSGQITLEYKGEECPIPGNTITVAGLAYDLDFGGEALNTPVTMSAKGEVDINETWSADATISSSTEWHLTYAHTGDAWSFG